MKSNRFLAMCFVIALSACSKEKGEPALEFNVNTNTQTVKVGEEVKFDISGNAGAISFYSGEIGNDYTYKDNPRVDDVDRIEVSFRTHNQTTNKITDPLPSVFHGATLKVMFSTDFSGTYDYSNINEANWTDITDRFHMSPMRHWDTGRVDEESGIADVYDLQIAGKPFYIAFKFESPTGIPAITYVRWRMYGLKVESFTASEKSAILGSNYSSTTYNKDYHIISRDNPQNTKTYLASSAMFFNPNPADTGIPQAPTVEEWGIGKAYLAKGIVLETDEPKIALAFGKPAINEYIHAFDTPGIYKVVFVATKYGNKEIVKEITVTVLPNEETQVPEV